MGFNSIKIVTGFTYRKRSISHAGYELLPLEITEYFFYFYIETSPFDLVYKSDVKTFGALREFPSVLNLIT